MLNAGRKWRAPRKSIARLMLFACFYSFTCTTGTYSAIASAHEASALEEQVKAAMVFKFLSYIDWPAALFETPDSPYRIWMLGASRVGREFQEISAERTVNNRPVEAFRTKSPSGIKGAHLVYVGEHAKRHLPRLAKLARQQNFVIVTENDEGLSPGSTINLRLIDGRMGFDVSLTTAQLCDLKLSARLLSVASTVEQQEP